MLDLTLEQIEAAKNNDLGAIRTLLDEMAPRISWLARDAATVGGHTNHQIAEDYEQDARVALWQALDRFAGNSVGEFRRFAEHVIRERIGISRREESRAGVNYEISDDAFRRWEAAKYQAKGDLDEAERLVQSNAAMGKGKALSATVARRVREATSAVHASLDASRTDLSEDDIAELMSTGTASEDKIRRTEVIKHVREVLDGMSDLRARVLRGAVGIDDSPNYGFELKPRIDRKTGLRYETAVLLQLPAMARDFEVTTTAIEQAWHKGKEQFKSRYTAAHGGPK